MKSNEPKPHCQIANVPHLAEGPAEPMPFLKSIRLTFRKSLGPRRVRKIKMKANNFLNWYAKLRGKSTKPPKPVALSSEMKFNAGDLVKVRSMEEIQATLNHWRQLKGCSFTTEMEPYCGTTQKVLKRVESFIDERDLKMRKTRGIVLLEGIICEGVETLGPCDRNCFYFWREEWLEKIGE
jgi:hypothetical protein